MEYRNRRLPASALAESRARYDRTMASYAPGESNPADGASAPVYHQMIEAMNPGLARNDEYAAPQFGNAATYHQMMKAMQPNAAPQYGNNPATYHQVMDAMRPDAYNNAVSRLSGAIAGRVGPQQRTKARSEYATAMQAMQPAPSDYEQ